MCPRMPRPPPIVCAPTPARSPSRTCHRQVGVAQLCSIVHFFHAHSDLLRALRGEACRVCIWCRGCDRHPPTQRRSASHPEWLHERGTHARQPRTTHCSDTLALFCSQAFDDRATPRVLGVGHRAQPVVRVPLYLLSQLHEPLGGSTTQCMTSSQGGGSDACRFRQRRFRRRQRHAARSMGRRRDAIVVRCAPPHAPPVSAGTPPRALYLGRCSPATSCAAVGAGTRTRAQGS